MCDYASYREQGHEPRQPNEPEEDPLKKWKAQPMTTIKQVERKHTGIEFLNDVVR